MANKIDEEGSFRCIVVEPQTGWLGETSKGTPYIKIPCVVNDPDSSQIGHEIFYDAYLSEAAVDRTVKDLTEVFGWNGDIEPLAAGEGFTGMECVIVAEFEEFEGKTRIKAKFLNSVNRVAPQLAKEKVSSLISRLNPRTKAISKATTTTAAPSQPATTKAPVKTPF